MTPNQKRVDNRGQCPPPFAAHAALIYEPIDSDLHVYQPAVHAVSTPRVDMSTVVHPSPWVKDGEPICTDCHWPIDSQGCLANCGETT
jgi:hypothetical protein